MSEIYITGCAMTRFGRHDGLSIPDLAQEAILGALADAGVERKDIQASYCANVFGGMILGQVILRDLEMNGPSVYKAVRHCLHWRFGNCRAGCAREELRKPWKTPVRAAPRRCIWRVTRCSPVSTTPS